MFQIYYPKYDSTLYELDYEKNTGVDSILELTKYAINSKYAPGTYWDNTYNSRILIKFDLLPISKSIVSGDIPPSAKFYLKLYVADSSDLPIQYNIYAYPLAEDWTNGNGTYGDKYQIKNGVSWKYRHGKPSGSVWNSGSGIELSYQSNFGGGAYYTSSAYVCSQSFDYENPDIRMDVTKLVKTWISGSIDNHGFILKRSNFDESGSSILGSLKFFSKETHTIYPPRLHIVWDDVDNSGIGNFSEIGENYSVRFTNIKPRYKYDSIEKIRIKCRDRYPSRTYVTSSAYELKKRLPTSSYYSIVDYASGDVIIPFDSVGTKISCDSLGNFFKLKTSNLFPERYYYLIIKIERSGDVVEYLDNYYMFKVFR